jgi:hypothetical protein
LPPNDQILMGVAISLVSLLGMFKLRWLTTNSTKGKKLVARFGEDKAFLILRILLLAMILFGTLLATGIINPIQWD